MKNKVVPYLLIFSCILISCSKEKICTNLPTGRYEVSLINIKSGQISKGKMNTFITTVKEDYILLLPEHNSYIVRKDTLYKEDCKVWGRISDYSSWYGSYYSLEGEISRKLIGGYAIEGTYTGNHRAGGLGNPNPYYTTTGTFEMKPTD